MKGFITFIREQGVVGLAMGFILGGAVSKVVSSFVNDILNPLVAIMFGNVSSRQNMQVSVGEISLKYGMFLSNLIDFIIMAAIVYFVLYFMALVLIN